MTSEGHGVLLILTSEGHGVLLILTSEGHGVLLILTHDQFPQFNWVFGPVCRCRRKEQHHAVIHMHILTQ